MTNLTFNGTVYANHADESVLETLLRENIQIPYGCQQGVCQSCLMRSLDVPPPDYSQMTLKDTLQQQNYFLACVCSPEQDMTVALPDYQGEAISATVVEKELLTTDIVRLVLEYETDFDFFAGQFVNLQRDDGLTRSYSIANRPHPNKRLEFHIRRLADGQFSAWVYNELSIGTTLLVSEPQGSCYYLNSNEQQPMLLIGTGTGLAPLLGIISDALAQGHSGAIHLYHGSRGYEGLYLIDEMRELSSKHSNFYYTPCLSGEEMDGFSQGRAHEVALSSIESLKGWRVYLCGHPDMVSHSKRMAYLKGASLADIYADAFHVAQTS